MGPLDSESNYRRPFERPFVSPFESPFKVLDWLLRGSGEVTLMLKGCGVVVHLDYSVSSGPF